MGLFFGFFGLFSGSYGKDFYLIFLFRQALFFKADAADLLFFGPEMAVALEEAETHPVFRFMAFSFLLAFAMRS